MTVSTDGYIALPQDHIRLIKILAKSPSGTVRCQTVSFPLSIETKYDALSYTWGNPPSNASIELDGRPFLIRKNLWRFLNQISNLDCKWPGLLWIDSISINQEDPEEKAQQVGMMGQIFQQARKVITWLGPAYGDSNMAIEALLHLNSITRNDKKQARFWSEAAGLALTRLCNRPYWTRLWVLQEILLSKEKVLMCGSKQTNWNAFEKTLTAIDTVELRSIRREAGSQDSVAQENEHEAFQMAIVAIHEKLPRKAVRNGDIQAVLNSPAMAMVRLKASQTGLSVPLWSLINNTRSLECAELRDKVFALLGIAAVHPSVPIKADYRRPLRCILNTVIRNHYLEQAPSSIDVVAKECGQLTDMFGLEAFTMFELGTEESVLALPQIRNISSCPLGDPSARFITLWWTVCYGQDTVQQLLLGYTKSTNTLLAETLEWASLNNEESVVNTLLSISGVNVKSQSHALARASACGSDRVVKMLIEAGADVNTHEEYYGAVLQQAVQGDNEEVVKMLIEARADVNAQGGRYGNALQAAVLGGNERMVKLLIEARADVNAQGGRYGNALQAAVLDGNANMVKILIEAGADRTVLKEGSLVTSYRQHR